MIDRRLRRVLRDRLVLKGNTARKVGIVADRDMDLREGIVGMVSKEDTDKIASHPTVDEARLMPHIRMEDSMLGIDLGHRRDVKDGMIKIELSPWKGGETTVL